MTNVVLKLLVRPLNRSKSVRLQSLQSDFTDCVRFHLERIESSGTINSTALHHNCYREARRRFRLPAATIQQAREKAIHAYKSYLERFKKESRTRPPMFRRPLPLRLGASNMRVFVDRSMLRVTTLDGFLWLPIIVPPCFFDAASKKHRVSELVYKGGRWYLMLVVTHEDVPIRDGGPHFGIDLGLANIAVLSGPGVVEFFDGKPLRYMRGRYMRYRKSLQAKRKTGMVKRSHVRESGWTVNVDHCVSRRIVNIVATHGGTLHVERLSGIRERAKGTKKVRRMLHLWSFDRLLRFVTYKAKQAGVPVIEEDPRHTSQRCSRCGHTERGNRKQQSKFECLACGYVIHADLNAARNLAAKGACSFGVGDVASPDLESSRRNGDVVVSRKGHHHGNRNLQTSSMEAIAVT